MKTKSFLRFAFAVGFFWTIAGCNGITPSQPNVYVNVEDSRHPGFALRFVSYVPTGDNAHDGKNILGLNKGMITFKGLEYYTFSVPKGIWDFYIEYTTPGNYSGNWTNERYRINTRENDWVRISWDLGDSHSADPEILQGCGEMY